jgi:hypothetical protein
MKNRNQAPVAGHQNNSVAVSAQLQSRAVVGAIGPALARSVLYGI